MRLTACKCLKGFLLSEGTWGQAKNSHSNLIVLCEEGIIGSFGYQWAPVSSVTRVHLTTPACLLRTSYFLVPGPPPRSWEHGLMESSCVQAHTCWGLSLASPPKALPLASFSV